MNTNMLTQVKVVSALAPVADAFDGTKTSKALNMTNYGAASFLVTKGVGLTGTSTITVEKCSASDGTGATAIPFFYERIPTGDTRGTLTEATTAGFTTTAGSDEMYLVHVHTNLEGLASGDKPWVRLKAVESVDSPVVGCIHAFLYQGNYGNSHGPSAIA